MLLNYRKRKNSALFVGVLTVFLIIFSSPARAELSREEEATIEVFERVSPSVVFIKNAALQWDWFSTYVYETPQGAGSGFIWDDEGHIVTNFHVIYQADRIEVLLADQKTYDAQVIGVSPDHDLAVLKIGAPRELLRSIPIGDSEDLKVGQKAISIGNPFGLDYSLTTGVVSALGRSMRSIGGRRIQDVIQTDAAINPGNSGGPLLDSSGRLIGVSTMIFSPSGASAGVGFAIPVNIVKRVVPQLIEYGQIIKVGLGVTLVPDYLRRRMGIEGAMVLDIQSGGGADQAGLQATRRDFYGNVLFGDVIVELDGEVIESNEDLIDFFEDKQAGDEVEIKFLRGRKEYGTVATLEELN